MQWLVGTDGWGMYIHQPLGAFDLTGGEGRLIPSADAPLDVFVTASSDPKVDCERVRSHHGTRRVAGALDFRLHAVASDPGRAR
jgi:hypothetical protein